MGALTLLLALGFVVVSLVRWRRLTAERRFLCVAFSAMALVALVFMPPHPIVVGGAELPSPSWLVWKAVPQFRVPTRWMPLLMTGLIGLASLALFQLRARLTAPIASLRWRQAAAGGLVLLAAAASFLELSIFPPARTVSVAEGPEYRILRNAAPGTLIEYPLGDAGDQWTSTYLFAQRLHRRPLVNGAAAGTFPDIVRRVLIDPSAPGVAGALATLGVKAVISRPIDHYYEAGVFAVPRELGEGYELVGSVDGGWTSVWNVVAKPEPFAVFPYGFFYSERYPGRLPFQWMGYKEGIVEVIAPRSGRYLVHFQAQSWREPRRLVIEGTNRAWAIDVPTSYTDFFVPVEIPRGRSTFTVRVDPPATLGPPGDNRFLSVYISNWLFEPLTGPLARVRPLTPRLTNPNPIPPGAS